VNRGSRFIERLKVLRSLQVVAWVTSPNSGDHGPTAVTELLSTIASPVFSELIIALMPYETCLPWAVKLFGELRAVHEVRPFKLVFSLKMIPDFREARQELAEALNSVTTKSLDFLDFLDSPPTIRITRSRHYKWDFLDFD